MKIRANLKSICQRRFLHQISLSVDRIGERIREVILPSWTLHLQIVSILHDHSLPFTHQVSLLLPQSLCQLSRYRNPIPRDVNRRSDQFAPSEPLTTVVNEDPPESSELSWNSDGLGTSEGLGWLRGEEGDVR